MSKHSHAVKFILVFGGISTAILFFFLRFEVIQILIPLGIIAFLYVGKFPFKKLINLRDVPFLKAHFVALVWAGVTVILPTFQSDVVLANAHWIFFVSIYAFILSLAIIFDIRDLELDEVAKKTVPQLLGKEAAVFVAIFLNLIAALLLIFLKIELLFSMIFVIAICSIFFFGARTKKEDFYFSFFLDGLILLFSGAITLGLILCV